MDNLPASPGLESYLSMLGALCLLLAVIFIGFWLLKRFGPTGGFGTARGMLRLEGHLPLGPRRSVVVVRFLNRVLVLGVTEQQINLLAEEESPHDVDVSDVAAQERRESRFARLLGKASGGGPGGDG